MGTVNNAIKTRRSKFGMKTSSIKGLGIQTKVIQMGGGSFKEEEIQNKPATWRNIRHKADLSHGRIYLISTSTMLFAVMILSK